MEMEQALVPVAAVVRAEGAAAAVETVEEALVSA